MNLPLLLSKLSAPVPASAFMPRQEIIRKLKRAESAKLILFHAGAGYGKSSSAARYTQDVKRPYTWYSISEEDDDLLPFLNYFCESIRQKESVFDLSFNQQEITDLPTVVTVLANGLLKIRRPLNITIDDFHLVDHVFSINYVLEKIIQHAPSHICFIVLSRSKPRWSSILKMKAAAQYVEVTEEDLRFSAEEVEVLFEDYFDKTLTAKETERMMEITEGWAIAVQLMAIQHIDAPKPFEQTVKPALQDVFSYLSEEVFSRHKTEEQEWLLSFSIFQTVTESFIAEFFGPEAGKFFAVSKDRNIFLQPFGESEAYRFHALFRQFLKTKWQQQDPKGYIAARKAASCYFLKLGDCVLSVHHAVQSEDLDCLREVLAVGGSRLIAQGQFDLLIDSLKLLSDSERIRHPILLLLEGEAYRYLAYYEKSRQAYSACLETASISENNQLISQAHAGIAHIYLDTIQPGLADPHLKKAIAAAYQSETISKTEMDALKHQFAENLVNLGKAAEAAEWIEREKLPDKLLQQGNLDVRLLIRTGKLREALLLLEGRNQQESTVPDSHRESEALLSLVYAMIGQQEAAAHTASLAIERGAKEKAGFVKAVGWIRRGHAESLSAVFPDDYSDSWYEKAIEKMDRLRVSRGKAEPYMGLAIVKARQGAIQEALLLGNKGLKETERVNDNWLSAYIRIGLAIILDTAGRYEEMLEEVKVAKRAFQKCGDTFGETVAYYWGMKALNALGGTEGFIQMAEELAGLVLEHEYQFFLTDRTLYGPVDLEQMLPLWQTAFLRKPESVKLSALCGRLGIQKEISYPGYQLLIRLSGPFSVSLGNREAVDSRWQRDRAKDIFVYLFLHRDRYVPKEELLDQLFSGDLSHADRNFKVALNALLKVLEPDRTSRSEPFFIIRRRSMYRFNPEAGWSCDLVKFRELMQQGIQEKNPVASGHLLRCAEKLYRGPFFEDREVEEWFRFERERYEQDYLFVLERLAQLTTRLQKYDETIFWAEKLLRIDHTWEEAYRLLMYAYYQKNSRPQAIRWYEKCRNMLVQEFGIKPMETTDKMYEIITRFS